MGKRSTKAETERRTDEVANLIVVGKKRAKIVQYIDEQDWDIGIDQINSYIRKAKDLLKKEGEALVTTKRLQLAKAIRRHDAIFIKCMQIQDYARANQAQKEINTLLALYEPPKRILEVNTWQDRAIEDIRQGLISYQDLEKAFDSDLATQLFARAGVPVSLSEVT